MIAGQRSMVDWAADLQQRGAAGRQELVQLAGRQSQQLATQGDRTRTPSGLRADKAAWLERYYTRLRLELRAASALWKQVERTGKLEEPLQEQLRQSEGLRAAIASRIAEYQGTALSHRDHSGDN